MSQTAEIARYWQEVSVAGWHPIDNLFSLTLRHAGHS